MFTLTAFVIVFPSSPSLFVTESVEDIPSVKKTIQQATSQVSKLLHHPNHDYKKLEVSDRQEKKKWAHHKPLILVKLRNLTCLLSQAAFLLIPLSFPFTTLTSEGLVKSSSLKLSFCSDRMHLWSLSICRISLTSWWLWRQSSPELVHSRPSLLLVRVTKQRTQKSWRCKLHTVLSQQTFNQKSVPLEWYLTSSSRFVSSLLEEPEVEVIGAGQGPAGSIIHSLFVNAQRVSNF